MTEEATVLKTAEESLGTELLKALIVEVQQLQSPWQNTPEREQQAIIDRLRSQVDYAVTGAVRRLACAGFTHLSAQVESLTIKDEAKAVLTLARGSEELHELADRVGTRAIIVFADATEFTDGMHTVKAEADQGELPLDDTPEPDAPPAEHMDAPRLSSAGAVIKKLQDGFHLRGADPDYWVERPDGSERHGVWLNAARACLKRGLEPIGDDQAGDEVGRWKWRGKAA